MAITMILEGPEEILSTAVDSFVRQGGWTESSTHTQLEFARAMLGSYIREMVSSYNTQRAAEIARTAALQQTVQALGQVAMNVTID